MRGWKASRELIRNADSPALPGTSGSVTLGMGPRMWVLRALGDF